MEHGNKVCKTLLICLALLLAAFYAQSGESHWQHTDIATAAEPNANFVIVEVGALHFEIVWRSRK
jgi:hypothetical protein